MENFVATVQLLKKKKQETDTKSAEKEKVHRVDKFTRTNTIKILNIFP